MIRDADFAAETANMTRAQILGQAATQALAMANKPAQLGARTARLIPETPLRAPHECHDSIRRGSPSGTAAVVIGQWGSSSWAR